jgi:type IV pilus assembly protein PilM
METQLFSMIRALGFEPNDPTTMIVHIGANNTQLAIISQTELALASNKTGGGTLFTKSIQQAVENLEQTQAQEYKHAYGLDPNQLQGKIRQAIMPGLNSVGQEVNKTLRFYNNQHPDDLVKRIVLSGGSAELPGLIEYFAELTGIEVLRASPFAPAQGNIPEDNRQAFIVTMGLMMRR